MRRDSVKRRLKNSLLQLAENFHRFTRLELELLASQIGVYLKLSEVPDMTREMIDPIIGG